MGVPLTFLERFNPDQFEIVGISGALARPMREVIPGAKGSGRFYVEEPDGSYKRLFDRIVIRHRAPIAKEVTS